ncbi:alpha-glucan family phosphorylase [Aminivibrio sp.]
MNREILQRGLKPIMSIPKHRRELGSSIRKLLESDPAFRPVAYMSMEIGIKESLPTYSGGLGILAGDILKSAADLGVPLIGLTLLYRKGYFQQSFNSEGWQTEKPVLWQPVQELTLLPNKVSLTLQGRDIQVGVWMHEIIGNTGYPLPVYFLDTDFDGNDTEDRKLTWHLYGGDEHYRLCQEMVLGVGGLRMLRDLGYNNLELFHMNEGHAGFISLELMREQGYYDPEKIKEQVIFTTHTPVPAGHDFFRFDLIERVLSHEALLNLKRMLPNSDGISMTELGIHFSRYVNAVSKKHAEVSRRMFDMPDIDWVTNGIHPGTWVGPGMRRLFDKHIPGWENDPGRLVQAVNLPSEDIWTAHQASKMRLLAAVMEQTGTQLDPDVLTIGFARRAAQYKRADLLFSNLKKLVDVAGGKIQIVFAGKAHPRDDGGKAVLQRLLASFEKIGAIIPTVFLENYDMEKGALITQGVDIWLNTPIRPREASGTSGMKCAINGVMNFSVLDGWWIEGWIEDVTGWSIGPAPSEQDMMNYDESLDAIDLYDKLEHKIIPTYYNDRDRWVWMMQRTIALNGSFFNTHRVIREYCEKAYSISFRGM